MISRILTMIPGFGRRGFGPSNLPRTMLTAAMEIHQFSTTDLSKNADVSVVNHDWVVDFQKNLVKSRV